MYSCFSRIDFVQLFYFLARHCLPFPYTDEAKANMRAAPERSGRLFGLDDGRNREGICESMATKSLRRVVIPYERRL